MFALFYDPEGRVVALRVGSQHQRPRNLRGPGRGPGRQGDPRVVARSRPLAPLSLFARELHARLQNVISVASSRSAGGGCGFLGWHIVDQLLNFPSETDPSVALPKPEGDSRFDNPQLSGRYPRCVAKVSVLDLRTTNNRLPGAQYYDGDITSEESLLAVFRAVKPDVVIHTATANVLEGNKELLHKVNVDGTKTLLEVAGGDRGDWGGHYRQHSAAFVCQT
ncbi:hypothetical protein CNMCM6106_000483 [Aspergillus hiratsukae]|uniref:3-beta hydroxysteroid dehydrogenase/isomerase domain-containing protein n=1 Tax=Aspergillus hiratsukae TaxID=1194566 RepID=A0A8H6PZN0_9EURO|nr:hypothetical protein CNMCM6106_000483 [Aspergillus hiratsukae]